jgi:hypothetical protein
MRTAGRNGEEGRKKKGSGTAATKKGSERDRGVKRNRGGRAWDEARTTGVDAMDAKGVG